MESIISFFQWIADLFGILFDFVVNFLESIINFFKIIPTVLTFITASIGYLPSAVMIYATVAVTVAIVLLVLGRSNN